jgi:hypothetical protein
MPVDRPYRRTCRQFVDGHYSEGGRWQYVLHPKYAQSPEHYVRAFLILLKDLRELFDYVEPADGNLSCYSYRIHSLLLRACVEVEANCKAILTENGYRRSGDWNMGDYRKIEKTHLLSGYEVLVPNWNGTGSIRKPFAAWASVGSLPWYRAYNTTKHDRHERFADATFDQMLDACCGLLVLLSAQFETNDFSPEESVLTIEGRGDGMESGIGGFFRVRFPNNWPIDLRYDFDWQQLKNEPDPFGTIDYAAIT